MWGWTSREPFLVTGAGVPHGGDSCISVGHDNLTEVARPLGDEGERKLVSFSHWAQDSNVFSVKLVETCFV